MRLDDYRCSDCGRVFEALLATGESAHCPECGSAHTERQLSGFAIGGTAGSTASPADAELPSYGGCANGMCGI
jgi:putative FmdB family regulatory protein